MVENKSPSSLTPRAAGASGERDPAYILGFEAEEASVEENCEGTWGTGGACPLLELFGNLNDVCDALLDRLLAALTLALCDSFSRLVPPGVTGVLILPAVVVENVDIGRAARPPSEPVLLDFGGLA
jgi:hypothetical protein